MATVTVDNVTGDGENLGKAWFASGSAVLGTYATGGESIDFSSYFHDADVITVKVSNAYSATDTSVYITYYDEANKKLLCFTTATGEVSDSTDNSNYSITWFAVGY